MWIIVAVAATALVTWKFLHWIVSQGWYSIPVESPGSPDPSE